MTLIICIQCGDRAVVRSKHSDTCGYCRELNVVRYIDCEVADKTQVLNDELSKLRKIVNKYQTVFEHLKCPLCLKIFPATKALKRHQKSRSNKSCYMRNTRRSSLKGEKNNGSDE